MKKSFVLSAMLCLTIGLIASASATEILVCSDPEKTEGIQAVFALPNTRDELPALKLYALAPPSNAFPMPGGSNAIELLPLLNGSSQCEWLPISQVSRGGSPAMARCHFRFGPDGGSTITLYAKSGESDRATQKAKLQEHGPTGPGRDQEMTCR